MNSTQNTFQAKVNGQTIGYYSTQEEAEYAIEAYQLDLAGEQSFAVSMEEYYIATRPVVEIPESNEDSRKIFAA